MGLSISNSHLGTHFHQV